MHGARWLVEAVQHIADNPLFIVKGFTKAGIPQALDGEESGESGSEAETLTDNNYSDIFSDMEDSEMSEDSD